MDGYWPSKIGTLHGDGHGEKSSSTFTPWFPAEFPLRIPTLDTRNHGLVWFSNSVGDLHIFGTIEGRGWQICRGSGVFSPPICGWPSGKAAQNLHDFVGKSQIQCMKYPMINSESPFPIMWLVNSLVVPWPHGSKQLLLQIRPENCVFFWISISQAVDMEVVS
jgi:hypothetical protein